MATWGQLGYASTKGGFGVHAESGLDHDERDLLIAGCNPGRKSFGVELPLLADASQVARFPRNLSYRWVPKVGGCYWHSSPAGADESGRTGNVFVHALLDRGREGQLLAGRPIEVWRSPTMLIPFGIAEVTAAVLPQLPSVPSDVVTRDQVVRFLTSFEVDRLSVLRQVLPALAEPRTRPLVLGVASPDEGALWVAAISYLLSAQAAREFSFVVWEAPDLLTADRLPAVELLCVEEAQIPSGLSSELGLQVVHSTHPDAAVQGESIALAWGELAEQLFSHSPEEIEHLLEEIDHLTSQAPVGSAHRAWPLAIAMACHLEKWPHLRDQLTNMLLQLTPPGIDQGRMWQVTEELIKERKDRHGTDLVDLLSDVRAAAPGPIQAMLHQGYVERAVQEPRWVADPARRKGSLGSRTDSQGEHDAQIRLAGTWQSPWVRTALERHVVEDPVDHALQLTWLMDFLLAERWDGGGPPVGELVASGAFQSLPTTLGDTALSEEFLGRLGPVSLETVTSLIRPSVTEALHDPAVRAAAPAGWRLSPRLVERLIALDQLLEPGPGLDVDEVLLEEAVVHYLSTAHSQELAPLVTDALTGDIHLTGVVDELLQALPHLSLSAGEMSAVLRRHRDRVPLAAVARSLAYGANDGLDELVGSLLAAPRNRGEALWGPWRVQDPHLCHAVQVLLNLVHDPVRFVHHVGNRGAAASDDLRNQFFVLQEGVGYPDPDGAGPEPLPERWLDYFDLVCSVSDLGRWRTERRRLFGTDAGAKESADYFASLLITAPGTRMQDRVREDLTSRIVFNAWFTSTWPAAMGEDRDRARPARSPAQHFAELLLDRADAEVDHYLNQLLVDVEQMTSAGRGYGPDIPAGRGREQDIDVLIRKAEDWFLRASGQSSSWRFSISKLSRRKS